MNLEEKDLDSIRRIELNGETYFNVKDLSKIIGNPNTNNLIKGVNRESVIKETIDRHKELFVDSFGFVSIFVKSRNEDLSRKSNQVFKYICDKTYIEGGELDYTYDPPLEVVIRHKSNINMKFFDKNYLPILSGLMNVGENYIPIYNTSTHSPLFSITEISNAFSVPTKKLLSKISTWNRDKMLKTDSVTGNRFSWFTGTVGVLEIIMKVSSNKDIERNRKIFNTIIKIVRDEHN